MSLLDGVLPHVAEILQFAGLRVIDTEAAGECRDVDIALGVAGHVVEAVTVERDLLLRRSCQRVVGVECIVGTNPVALLLVAENELYSIGSRRTSHDATVGIETVDAHALDAAPREAPVALADRRDGRTDAGLLVLEAPAAELHRPLGDERQALSLQTYPEVAGPVREDATYLSSIHISTEYGGLKALQPVTTLDNAEHTMASRTYIYNIILILFYAIEENLLAGKGTHVDVGIRYGVVAETGDATQANDIHLAIALDEALGLSFRLKMAEVVARFHDNGIARSRLPETSLRVLEDTAEIVVVGSVLLPVSHPHYHR